MVARYDRTCRQGGGTCFGVDVGVAQCQVGGVVFFGIRGKAAYQEDLAKVNPMHVVAAGLLGILLLVVSLIGLVNWIVAK